MSTIHCSLSTIHYLLTSMIPSLRQEYNRRFSQAGYEALLAQIEKDYPGQLEFRISETPAFMDRALRQNLEAAGEYIIDFISQPGFKAMTEKAIPADCRVPNEPAHTQFLAIDYAICQAEDGSLEPKLIELQGFPSLFAFQDYFSKLIPQHVYVPEGFDYLFSGLTSGQYQDMLRRTLLGSHRPEEVILLEIEPERQKTRIDFECTRQMTGVRPVCVTKVQAIGNRLYYDRDGERQLIRRIYNRVIFDELQDRKDLQLNFDFATPYDVEWTGHPGWFFRISKYLLPVLDHVSSPKARRVSEFNPPASELHKYVLKPLYSFAGQGVVFDVTPEDVAAVTDRENWILQEKVNYAPSIASPVGGVKCEIRLLYLWPDGDARPTLCTNLIRLSQGSMMGVRFNKDKTWVGGNTAFLER